MVIIDAGQKNGIDLDHNIAFLKAFNGGKLTFQHQFCALGRAHGVFAVPDPGINLGADFRVHRVDGDAHMGRINIFQFIQVGMDVQAVGGHAQEHFRISCTHLGQGFHRFVAVGKGIARTCNAHYGCVGFGLNDLCQVSHGLIRTQNGGGDPGAAFIDTVKLSVAKIALDVTGRGNREVNSTEILAGLFIKTGMVI